jgi:hypothetical protein
MSVPAPHNSHDRAVAPRPVALVLAGALVLGACGSGGSGAEGACGPITREALDRGFLVHVLEDDGSIEYTSDPPTSGPHRPSPPVSGTLDEPLPRPVQVGILERGDVLVQHRPDVDASALAGLAADRVVIAPNPDLPAPVVGTAWLYKRTCTEPDVEALQRFVDARVGHGPDEH